MPTEGWEGEIGNHDWGGFVSAQGPPPVSGCCSLEASIRAEADSGLSTRIDALVSGDIFGYAKLDEPNVFTDVNTFSGGIRLFQTTVSADYDLTANDYEVLVDASAGDVVITLPDAIGTGQLYRIKKIDSSVNIVTVIPQSGDLIDGTSEILLSNEWDGCSLIDASLNYWDKVTEPFPVLPDDMARLGEANVFTNINTLTGLRVSTQTVFGDTTLTALDFEVLVDATSGPIIISLPASAGNGQNYRIKKIDASENLVTVQADGSDLIDGSTSLNFFDQWVGCTVIDATVGYWDNLSPASGGVETFIELLDVPLSYTGAGNQLLRVTSAEDGIEFVSLPPVAVSVTSAEVSALVQIASAAATSADAHANTVSARVVSVSAELNSLLTSAAAALSTRIDGVSGAGGSVTSQEVSALVQIASAAATSADSHANTVSGRVVSVSAELVSLVQIASAAATSAINKAISDNTSLSAVITASINTVSARVVSVSAELASLVQIASAAATSADSHANTISARAVSISAELNSLLASVEHRLSTRIDTASGTGGAASVTSQEVSVIAAGLSSRIDGISVGPGAALNADAPNSTIPINVLVGAPANIVSKSVTFSAGDQVTLRIWGTILNNSGTTRTYAYVFNLGSVTGTWTNTTTTANSATLRSPVFIEATFSVNSTSSAWFLSRVYAGQGVALGTGITAPTTAISGMVAQQSASNLTGAQTINVQMYSSSATATQSFELTAWNIIKMATNP